MTGSSEANAIVTVPITAETVRSCLEERGWQINLVADWSIVAVLKTRRKEYSVLISWKESNQQVLVTAKVVALTGSQAALYCARQALGLVAAIRKTSGCLEEVQA